MSVYLDLRNYREIIQTSLSAVSSYADIGNSKPRLSLVDKSGINLTNETIFMISDRENNSADVLLKPAFF